jgi:hypothetical protein
MLQIRFISPYCALHTIYKLPQHVSVNICSHYSLNSSNNKAQVFTLCDPKDPRGPPLLLHVPVACLLPSSGRSHLEAVTPLVGYRPQVALQPQSVNTLTVVNMPPKHVGVKVGP